MLLKLGAGKGARLGTGDGVRETPGVAQNGSVES